MRTALAPLLLSLALAMLVSCDAAASSAAKRRTRCLSNVHALEKACREYESKNGSWPPSLAEALQAQGLPKDLVLEVLKCPETGIAYQYRKPKAPLKASIKRIAIWDAEVHPAIGDLGATRHVCTVAGGPMTLSEADFQDYIVAPDQSD